MPSCGELVCNRDDAYFAPHLSLCGAFQALDVKLLARSRANGASPARHSAAQYHTRPASPAVDDEDREDQVTRRTEIDEDRKQQPRLTFDAEADYAAVDHGWEHACYGYGVEFAEEDAQRLPQPQRDTSQMR